jgi:DNA-binding PadR family transcriptional regulator
MILTMLASLQPLTVNQVWRRTPEGNRGTAERMLKAMKRQGLASSRIVKKADDQTNRKYALTPEGKMVALAVAYEYRGNRLGIDYRTILEELSQPSPKRETIDALYSYWALNMLSRGLVDDIMDVLHETVKTNETEGRMVSPALRMIRRIPTIGRNAKPITESLMQALQALTETERREANLYLKNDLQGQLQEVARITADAQLSEDIKATMKDPFNLVMTGLTKKCKDCGKVIGEIRITPETAISAVLTPEITLPCPHCGANLLKGTSLDEATIKRLGEMYLKKLRPTSKLVFEGTEAEREGDERLPINSKLREDERS